MKNIEQWKPSKFVFINGKLKASRNKDEVNVSSRLVADAVAEKFEKFIPKYCSGSLLDLGCGKAPLYETYSPHVSDVICMDWVNSFHDLCYIDIACDLSKPLPLSSNSFDTIILSDVLEHIPEPQQLWMEMSRIIKPNGKLLLSVPFYYWLHEEPFDYYRYTEHALRRFAKLTGFEIIIIEQYGGSMEIIIDILAKNVCNLHWRLGPIIADYIQRSAYMFIKKRNKNNAKLTAFPLGYFLVLNKI